MLLMSIRSYRVSNLLIWACVASYVEFCLFEKSRLKFLHFLAWFMHCQQGAEVWAWIGLLHAFKKFPSGFELFLSSGSFPGGIGLTGEGHRSDRCSSQVFDDHVHRSDRSELSCCNCSVSCGVLHAFVQGELHWFRGSLHVCRGSSLWFRAIF
jgi:hypothetical protein